MTNFLSLFATACDVPKPTNFLGFPRWYQYLPGSEDGNGNCLPALGQLSNVWLVVAAIIEILLRIATLAAVAMIIYGGIKYITSQGNPDETNKARGTIVNALIGLLLAITAAAFVDFLAGR